MATNATIPASDGVEERSAQAYRERPTRVVIDTIV